MHSLITPIEEGAQLRFPTEGPGRSLESFKTQHARDQLPACAQVYDEPTVLLCYRVTGEEEVPEGVVGVLTPDAPDVLSHLSVRARNMKVGTLPSVP